MGLDVPGDVSVIGFDDSPEAARTTPPLSTVRQPIQQMGSAAVELLIALMDGPHTRDYARAAAHVPGTPRHYRPSPLTA